MNNKELLEKWQLKKIAVLAFINDEFDDMKPKDKKAFYLMVKAIFEDVIADLKLFATPDVRRLLRKEYCNICGQELTEIRGRYPKEPRRKVCACCATEKLEWLEEQNNVEAKCSNNA